MCKIVQEYFILKLKTGKEERQYDIIYYIRAC